MRISEAETRNNNPPREPRTKKSEGEQNQILLACAKAIKLFNRLRPSSVESRNILFLQLDIALQGVVAGGAAAYLSVFVVRLGASAFLVGLLTSVPALVTALFSIPAGRFVARQRNLVPVVVKARIVFRVSYLVIALVPFFAPEIAAPAIVVIWALASVASAFAMVAFTAAMAELVPPRQRASIISLRYATHATISAITLPITGRILESFSFPIGYQIVFFISFVAAMLSVWAYGRIHLPDQVVPVVPASKISPIYRMKVALASLRAQPSFLGYLLSSGIFRLGLNLPAALFSIYWVNHLLLSDGDIALATTIMNVTSVLGYFYWGNLARRRGHAPVLVASSFGLAIYPIMTAMSGSLLPILVASAAGGWFSAGINLAFFNVLLAVSPQIGRSSYVALDTMTANTIAFAGPILGSLLTSSFDIRLVLLFSGAIRALGGMLFVLKKVHD